MASASPARPPAHRANRRSSSLSPHTCLDQPKWLLRRDKHFIFIFQTEGRQIEKEEVFVRHGHIDSRNFREGFQGRFSHLKQSCLRGGTVIIRENFQHRGQNRVVRSTITFWCAREVPGRPKRSGENSIGGLLERCVFAFRITFEPRTSRLQD